MPDISPSLPITGQPNSSEEPKIVTALSQLVAAVNNVDAAQLATEAKPSTLMGAYRTLWHGVGWLAGGSGGPGSYILRGGSKDQWLPSGQGQDRQEFLYIDPADYAITGLSTVFRTRIALITNNTAPGVTFDGHLLQALTVGGSASDVGFGSIGGDVLATTSIVSPALGTKSHAESLDTAIAAAGFYVPTVAISATLAAAASVLISYQIMLRHTP